MSSTVAHAAGPKSLDIAWVRQQFPSLHTQVNGQPPLFWMAPPARKYRARSSTPSATICCTPTPTPAAPSPPAAATTPCSPEHAQAMADFFNCAPDEVVFGQNMTTITFALSRAIGRELKPGDEIVVTTLDHDANVAPWRAFEEKGVVIRQVDIQEADCTLDLEDLKRKITDKTKLVAVGYASNAVGTINPVAEITKLAHAAGALIFIDAVHYAPHGPIDVKALDCDFLACSPYKFFGPHMGTLYGKREHLLRFSPVQSPPRTERVAGSLGNRHAGPGVDRRDRRGSGLSRGTRTPPRSRRARSPQRAARRLSRHARSRNGAVRRTDGRTAGHSGPPRFRH